MIYVFYVLAGVVSGVFGGLGMGGGTLLIPILTLFLGVEQKLAQGINLVSFLVMAIFSMIIHYKNGYIVTKHIGYIIFFGMVFSVLGAFLMTILPSRIIRVVFGVFLCLLAIFDLYKTLKKKDKKMDTVAKQE